MTTKRILPADVIAAYKQTGLKPKRVGASVKDGQTCGLGAIWRAKHSDYDDSTDDSQSLYDGLFAVYGSDYVRAFYVGFDGAGKVHTSPEALLGHTDGRAAAEAVFAMEWEKA